MSDEKDPDVVAVPNAGDAGRVIAKYRAILERQGALGSCSACGAQDWAPLGLGPSTPQGPTEMMGGRLFVIQTASFFCKNCGYISMHYLPRLDDLASERR